MKFNVTNKTNRSHAVTTLVAKNFDLLPFKNWIESNTGVELGIGLGFEGPEYHDGNSAFRIAHMGHLNPHMILGVIASLEMGLIASKIPFEKGGLDNAIDYLRKKGLAKASKKSSREANEGAVGYFENNNERAIH